MSQSVVLGVGLGVGAAAYLAVAGYVWLHRRAAGGRGLVVLLLAVFVWSLCYAFELSTHTVASARVWSGLKFLGIVTLAPSFWAFVTAYSGRRGRLRSRTVALLSIEPALVLILLAIPGTSGLIHTYTAAELAAPHLDRAPVAGAGALFWPHAAYTYAVLLSAVGMLVARLKGIAEPYRRQASALIVAALTPILGNLLYNLRPGITAGVDPTPFLFAVTAVVLVWGFFRLRLLDLAPVARSQVVEQMVDGVLVLDAYGRVVDANPAGAALLATARHEVVGRYVTDLLPGVARLLTRHAAGEAARGAATVPSPDGNGVVDLALSVTWLADASGAQTGRLVVLSDVTEQMATQRRLRDLLEEQTRLAGILQTSLRPAALPQVPGLVMAARSLPGDRGGSVGGDFYDVHPATGGDWAFVLGDVSGKGVQAAVVTSMARYTVRTLSAQGWTPPQVLQQLNQVLLEPDDPERFCTVVYGRTSSLPGGALGGVRIRLALGGHPAPLVRRRDGSIAALGDGGTALGLLPTVQIGEQVVDLAPGELLLAYTDGVTEARHGVEEFGDGRLAEVIAASVATLGRSGTGVTPRDVVEAVADGVIRAVTEFTCNRDDVAVLVMAVA